MADKGWRNVLIVKLAWHCCSASFNALTYQFCFQTMFPSTLVSFTGTVCSRSWSKKNSVCFPWALLFKKLKPEVCCGGVQGLGLVNSFLTFSQFLSLTKASPNSGPCSRPVQAAVFAVLTSFVFQRLCWGNHQNCTTQSMRYGLIIFIATTDLLYLNWGLRVIDTEGLIYLSFTLYK